jgi:hypothetical protein
MPNANMLANKIPIDFVAGSHGHFLETTLNKYFNIVDVDGGSFTSTGTSHRVSRDYVNQRLFYAEHWSERLNSELRNVSKLISIKFDQDDLLLLSSVSLLRAADLNINNDALEFDTVNKLNNIFYQDTLELLYQSYPFLDRKQPDVPRYVLREFYKFGFRDTEINGYWLKQKNLVYCCNVFYFNFKDFYNINLFVARIKELELFLGRAFDFSTEFYQQHQKFISFIPYIDHKHMCDHIVLSVQQGQDIAIPRLTLFQESYINAQLENIFNREMPFHQDSYFTSTKDVLYYINNHAPRL